MAALPLASLADMLVRSGGVARGAPGSVRGAKSLLAQEQMTTELNHLTRAEKLLRELGTDDAADLVRRYQDVEAYLERPGAYKSSSRMSFYSTLCALLNPDKPFAAPLARAAGRGKAREALKLFRERGAYWSRRVSEKQLRLTRATTRTGGALPFREILAAYRKRRSALSAEDSLLADMYLAAPDSPEGAVRRANYGCCWVLDAEPAGDRLPARTNYVVVPRCSRRPVTIVLNRYKTARSHGEYRAALPEPLAGRVRQSLLADPRPLLFYSKADGGFQCLTPNAFAKRVVSVMRQLTGAPLGVNQLRRSYSSYVIDKGLTDGELAEFARGMNSSVGVMKRVYQRRSLMA